MPTQAPKNLRSFQSLVEVVKALRDPVKGCPWDIKQTHLTLTPHMIEEAHELVEAIEANARGGIIEELGDVLLQVLLHSEIAHQNKEFELLDVIEKLNEKLVFRHPHVFGDVKAETAQEALENWERLKQLEKKDAKPDGFGIPPGLPALQRAQKIGAKTKNLHFDWTKPEQVLNKIEEEMMELKLALESQNPQEIQSEIGDVLFTIVQLSRHLNVEAEAALRQCNGRFEKRFFYMKNLAEAQGRVFEELAANEMEQLWHQTKRELSNDKNGAKS